MPLRRNSRGTAAVLARQRQHRKGDEAGCLRRHPKPKANVAPQVLHHASLLIAKNLDRVHTSGPVGRHKACC
jgi:hypothetical protein